MINGQMTWLILANLDVFKSFCVYYLIDEVVDSFSCLNLHVSSLLLKEWWVSCFTITDVLECRHHPFVSSFT